MVKDFKGQVKVADVQTAFDEIVGKVNSLVTSYNSQKSVEDIDYTTGGANLAPSGYTLSVGGMKQFIQACEGCVVGGKPFKVDDNHLKMSTGMLVSRDGIFKLPDSVLTIPTDKKYRTVYFNTVTQDYEWVPTGHSVIVKKYVNIGSPLIKDETNDYYYSDYNLGYGYNSLTGGSDFAFWYNLDDTNKTVDLDMSKYITLSCDIMTAGNYVEMDFSHYSTNDEYNMQNRQLQFWFGNLNSNGKTFKPAHLISTSYVLGQLYCSMSLELGSIYESSGKATISTRSTRGFSNTIYGTSQLKSIRYYFYNNAVQARYVTEDNAEINIGTINLNDDLRNLNINCIIFNNNGVEYGPSNPSVTTTKDYNYRIKDHYKVCSSEGSVISTLNTDGSNFAYYDVVIEPAEDISYRICDIDPNSSSKFIGTNVNTQNEQINGTYRITNVNKDYTNQWVKNGDDDTHLGSPWYQTVDTSTKPKFVIGMPSVADGDYDSGLTRAYLFGEQVVLNANQGPRANQYWCPATYLYLPKGVENPYTYYNGRHNSTDPRYSSQKVLNVTITKQIKSENI